MSRGSASTTISKTKNDSKKRSRLFVIQLHGRFLDEEEFCALYDVNSTDYPVFEHGKYRRFDLNEVSEEECFGRFRFSDKVIPYLGRILRLPEKLVCENRTAAYTEEGLCILLQRLAYPCRYPGMITQLGKPLR